ncbi:MAG: DUF4347 domain-containing protein [Cyanobacteriota bacterium]
MKFLRILLGSRQFCKKQNWRLPYSRLSLETLPRYAALLSQWRGAIAQGANILLYDCRVAAEGLRLVNARCTP